MELRLKILKNIYRHKVRETVIDYEIEYDITGKIYSSRALVFDLPENVQKLMLGGEFSQVRQEITDFKEKLKVILPLGMTSNSSLLRNELLEIYKAVDEEVQDKKIVHDKIYELAEEESLEYYILTAFFNPESLPEVFSNALKKFRDYIEDEKEGGIIDVFLLISGQNMWLYYKVIRFVIPFISNRSEKSKAYDHLQHFVNPRCRAYLLSELIFCKDGEVLGGLFKALSLQEIKDQYVQELLIDIFKSDIKLGNAEKSNMFEVLKKFPNQKTILVGLEILKENRSYSSSAISRGLIEIGYSTHSIAKIMLPKLKVADPKESEAAFMVFCYTTVSLKEYISYRELFDIYVKTLEVGSNWNITRCMYGLIPSYQDRSALKYILKFLEHDSADVLEGILLLISHFGFSKNIGKGVFQKSLTKRKYIKLLDHSSEKVVQRAIHLLYNIGANEYNKEYVFIFLSKINFDRKSVNNLRFMDAINGLHLRVPFNSAIKTKYLQALEQDNSSYKVMALIGLIRSKDLELKKSLAYLKDDPSSEVRDALKKMNELGRKYL